MSVIRELAERMRQVLATEATATTAAYAGLDEAMLARAQSQAAASVQEAVSACQELGASVAQQRAHLDAASDRSRLLVARAQESRAHLRRIRDTLERVKLVALNTGLDGARVGEARGRALLLVAEELGELVRGGLGAVTDLGSLQAELDEDRDRLAADLAQARAKAGDVSQEILRAQSAQRRGEQAIDDLGQKLAEVSGTDAESARLFGEVAEHARGLLSALGALSSKPQRGLVWRALRPTLGPLLRVLRELERPGPAAASDQ